MASGEVELGNRLYVNGKACGLDGKGASASRWRSSAGQNQIVFRTSAATAPSAYYVRDVSGAEARCAAMAGLGTSIGHLTV